MLQGALLRTHPHDTSWDANHSGIVGYRVHYYRTRTHFYVIADSYVSQHLCARAHHYPVAKGRMALTPFVAGAAQGHALVKQHIVANLRGLADHYAGTVIDK